MASIEITTLDVNAAAVGDKRLTIDQDGKLVLTDQPFEHQITDAEINEDSETPSLVKGSQLLANDTFEGLSSAVAFVTAYPNKLTSLSTVSYRTQAECTTLGITYPDGGGADYVIVVGYGAEYGGLITEAGSVQLLNYRGNDATANAKNLGKAWEKLKINNASVTIACVGDSMTAGQDANSPDSIPSPFGNPISVASIQYPAAMGKKLSDSTGANHNILNHGYSGDTAKQGFARWTTNPNADVVHIMYGINDSNGVNGATFDEYMNFIELNIRKYILWGCGVVVHTTTPREFGVKNRSSYKFSQALISLANQYGCPVFESESTVKNCKYDAVYSDPTHFTAHGYHRYGVAVAAFIMAGGWVDRFLPISSAKMITAGEGRGGVGYFSTGAVFGSTDSGFLLDKSQVAIQDQDDRVTYSFYLDAEFADLYSVMTMTEGVTIELSDIAPPTFVGDERGDGSRNRLIMKAYTNRNIIETGKYQIPSGRFSSGNAKLSYIGSFVGSGWKTVSFYCESALTGAAILTGLYVETTKMPYSGGYHDQLGGRVSDGKADHLIYQIPYFSGSEGSSSVPTAQPLPASIDLPSPLSLLPYQAPQSSFYDSIPTEILINRSGAGAWCKILIHRTSGSNVLAVEEVSVGSNGAALVPSAASIVSAEFDHVSGELLPVSGTSLSNWQSNQFLRLEFGATPASYYKIIINDMHKAGNSEAGAV